MSRLIWIFAGRTAILLVLSCRGSFRRKSFIGCLTAVKIPLINISVNGFAWASTNLAVIWLCSVGPETVSWACPIKTFRRSKDRFFSCFLFVTVVATKIFLAHKPPHISRTFFYSLIFLGVFLYASRAKLYDAFIYLFIYLFINVLNYSVRCFNVLMFLFCCARLQSIYLNLMFSLLHEPPRDKTNKMTMRPAKTQISLGVRPVWSESLLCWVAKDPMRTAKTLTRLGGWPADPSFQSCGHREDSRSKPDWADAQADVSLRWAHMPFC